MEQPIDIVTALGELIEKYRQAYFQARDEFPKERLDPEWPSECQEETGEEFALWQPVKRTEHPGLTQVEEAMSTTLHPDAASYWGSFYSGNIFIDSEYGVIELLQPWNEEDFTRFQENLIGHLLTQKRFKLPYTVFIGAMYEGEQVVAVDDAGAVWLELPGRKRRQKLADSLSLYLAQAEPVILPE